MGSYIQQKNLKFRDSRKRLRVKLRDLEEEKVTESAYKDCRRGHCLKEEGKQTDREGWMASGRGVQKSRVLKRTQ